MDLWLYGHLSRQPYKEEDFAKLPAGGGRLAPCLRAYLSSVAPLCVQMVGPWVERLVKRLLTTKMPTLLAQTNRAN